MTAGVQVLSMHCSVDRSFCQSKQLFCLAQSRLLYCGVVLECGASINGDLRKLAHVDTHIFVHSFVENVFNSFGSMGLQPWEHYIPINPDALTICNSLKKAMMWIELHPAQAAAIGHVSPYHWVHVCFDTSPRSLSCCSAHFPLVRLNGQEFARQRLSFDAIHESIFQLLQSYGVSPIFQ